MPESSVFWPWQHGCSYLLLGRLSGILLLGKAQEMMPALSMKLRWTWEPQHMMKIPWRWVWLACFLVIWESLSCQFLASLATLSWNSVFLIVLENNAYETCLEVVGDPHNTEVWYGRTKKTLNFFLLLPFRHIPSLEINTVNFLMQGFSTRSSFAAQETFDNI